MIKVYGASKLSWAPFWKELREEWTEIEWTARWPTDHVGKVPDHETFASVFWMHDEEDVRKADIVMIMSNPEDKLRGALVEAGMAIAYGKSVLVVGKHDDYGTWQYHPSVYRVDTLADARLLLSLLAQ